MTGIQLLMVSLLLLLLPLGKCQNNVFAKDKTCNKLDECIKREDCKPFLEKHERWKGMSKFNSDYDKLKDELRNAVCNREEKGVCCPKSCECIPRKQCPYADQQTQLYNELNRQGKKYEASQVLNELKERVCNERDRHLCCPIIAKSEPSDLTTVPTSR